MEIGLVLLHLKHELLEAELAKECPNCDTPSPSQCELCQNQIEEDILADMDEFASKVGIPNIRDWLPQLTITGGR